MQCCPRLIQFSVRYFIIKASTYLKKLTPTLSKLSISIKVYPARKTDIKKNISKVPSKSRSIIAIIYGTLTTLIVPSSTSPTCIHIYTYIHSFIPSFPHLKREQKILL